MGYFFFLILAILVLSPRPIRDVLTVFAYIAIGLANMAALAAMVFYLFAGSSSENFFRWP
jgi:hypothetical protein